MLIAALYTLLIAFGGFIIGVSVGLLLAIIMQRSAFMERGLLPFVIASQTVPLIALAPLIVGIGNRISFGPFQWGQTQSIMFIAAYLAFFPLSVGALRGLNASTPTQLELMRSYAASPRSTLWKLRFPASVPYLVPALKVSAAAAVVGTVVAQDLRRQWTAQDTRDVENLHTAECALIVECRRAHDFVRFVKG